MLKHDRQGKLDAEGVKFLGFTNLTGLNNEEFMNKIVYAGEEIQRFLIALEKKYVKDEAKYGKDQCQFVSNEFDGLWKDEVTETLKQSENAKKIDKIPIHVDFLRSNVMRAVLKGDMLKQLGKSSSKKSERLKKRRGPTHRNKDVRAPPTPPTPPDEDEGKEEEDYRDQI